MEESINKQILEKQKSVIRCRYCKALTITPIAGGGFGRLSYTSYLCLKCSRLFAIQFKDDILNWEYLNWERIQEET